MGRHDAALHQAEQLQQEVVRLNGLVAEKEAEINGLSEKNKIVKLAKSLAGADSGEKSTELKLKINELLREVDKCMALLNK